ncbi:MAG: ParB N-terminal domain-containing protein, partial [Candidatus Nealsonbacteria bacterium]|nr:ParB N-terminal domain-containing protein [Candidatus Nealsonbacteria bacterium]
MQTTQFDIEIRAIDSIRPYEHNPRKNDSAVDAVAASLREFGFRQPIVVDTDGVIIAGHTRYKAALKLGLEKVPVHVATDLSPEQIRAYRLADNKTGELATWDFEILPIELAALQEAGYELDILGFDDEELANLLDTELQQGLTDPDTVPEPPDEAVTRPGDLWSLDDHRLLCGDATDGVHMARLMGDVQADLLLTDPPYNVAYQGKTKDALTIENDAMEDSQFRGFLVDAFRNADAAMHPGAAFYVWHADSEGYNFRGACRDAGWKVRQCLIWAKSVLVMGRQDYQWKHEPCLYGWKPGSAHQWMADRRQTT